MRLPDFICFKDGHGRLLEMNNAGIELYGLQDVDYRGKTNLDLADETAPILREVFKICTATDERAWQAGEISRGDEVVPTPTGEERVFDVIKVPMFNETGSPQGLVVLGRDITERKRSEALLRNSEANLQAIFNNSGQGILLLDVEAKVEYANQIAPFLMKRAYGKTIAVDDSLYTIFSRYQAEIFRQKVQKVRRGQVVTIEQQIVGDETANDWLEINLIPVFGENGEVRNIWLVARDISQRLLAEENLRLLHTAIASISDGVLITEAQPKLLEAQIVFANNGVCHMTGYTQEELLGQPLTIFQGAFADSSLFDQLQKQAGSGGNLYS